LSAKLIDQVLVMVFFGIAVLISGVVLLSLKSSAKSATDPYTVSARPTPSMRLNPRSRVVSKQSEHDEHEDETEHGSPSRPKRDEVMWEVGSVSDDEDGVKKVDDPDSEVAKPQGLGEGSGGHGERRGLLDEEEEIEGEDRDDQPGSLGKDENEEFGEYEAVRRTSLDGPLETK
jgi:hypothetical protein